MVKKQKEEIKIKCFFKDNGEDITQIIKTSLFLFLKNAGDMSKQGNKH